MLNRSSKQIILLLCLWWPDTDIIRIAEGFGTAFCAVCSCASPSPAVGLLCDGACRKGIGGTFHTLGAARWGRAGSSLMNRVHLTEWKGPPASLVKTWFTDQSRVIPVSSNHTLLLLLRLLLLGVLVVFHLSSTEFALLQSALHETHLVLTPICLNYLFPSMPMVNPEALVVGFSDSLALLSQVEHPADSFQPSSSTQPAALTVRW